jgi:hypothetical protein
MVVAKQVGRDSRSALHPLWRISAHVNARDRQIRAVYCQKKNDDFVGPFDTTSFLDGFDTGNRRTSLKV